MADPKEQLNQIWAIFRMLGITDDLTIIEYIAALLLRLVQRQSPVGFAQNRVVDQGFEHRRFEIVRHHPFGHAAKALKGSPVQGQPGRHFLVKDQLGVLVTTVAQGGHKDVGRPQPTADRVE